MTTTTDTLTNLNAYHMTNLADCASPDSLESPGAIFLTSVRDAVAEAIDWRRENNEPTDLDGFQYDGGDHEIADGAVPVYTYDVWRTFTDLAAWQEDPTELGADASDMEQAAKVCLYMIASRLVTALVEEYGGTDDDDDETEEDDAS
jgi:hypothetical protein